MRRVFLCFSLLFLLLSVAGFAAETADQLYEKGKYGPALQEYEKQLTSAEGEARYKLLLRVVTCEVLLFRYEKALLRLSKEALPADPLWNARFRIYRAQLAREFSAQYGYGAPTESEEGNSDPARKTQAEWRKESLAEYRLLWEQRKLLASRSLKDEAEYFELKNSDLDQYPTLLDFVVDAFTDTLGMDDISEKIPALDVLNEKWDRPYSVTDSPALQIASLFEATAQEEGLGRAAAREYWRLKRALLVQNGRITFQNKEDKATEKLLTLLLNWKDNFQSPAVRAKVTVEIVQIYLAIEKFSEAVSLCKTVEKEHAGTWQATRCYEHRAQIEMPQIQISVSPQGPGPWTAEVKVRNLSKVYAKIYETTPEALLSLRNGQNNDYSSLRVLHDHYLKSRLSQKPTDSLAVDSQADKPYGFREITLTGKALRRGFYVLVVSEADNFTAERTLAQGSLFYISDLMVFGSGGFMGMKPWDQPSELMGKEYPAFHVYTLTASSGQPASKSRIDMVGTSDWKRQVKAGVTDSDGIAQFSAKIDNKYTYHNYDALASRGEDRAILGQNFSLQTFVPQAIEVHIETDRAIYRPGQKVKYKVTALRKHSYGYSLYDGKSVARVRSMDPNGKVVSTQQVKLNAFGGGSGEFVIPSGRLLGAYNLDVSLPEGGNAYSDSRPVQVEEYKRPEFEVKLSPTTTAWKYGEKGKVEGDAKYYFGGSVPNAPLTYRVTREQFMPWFCWWFRHRPVPSGKNEVAFGKISTDANGHFTFELPITPPEDQQFPARYIVHVEARDQGGRTIKASRTYAGGPRALWYDLKFATQFMTPGRAAHAELKTLNLDEQPIAAKGSFTIHRVEASEMPESESINRRGRVYDVPLTLDAFYEKTSDGEKVASGKFSTTDKSGTKLTIPPLTDGAYRLTVTADDPFGGKVEQKVHFLVSGAKFQGKGVSPAVAIAEFPKYEVGETAEILLGWSGLKSGLYVEVFSGSELLRKSWVSGEGLRKWSLPITKQHRGGVQVRWFGVQNRRVVQNQVAIEVPWTDRELVADLKIEKKLRPGQRVDGVLSLLDSQKKPVEAEALLRVYDRSLDYYQQAQAPWVNQLYGSSGAPNPLSDPMGAFYAASIFPDWNWFRNKILGSSPKVVGELGSPVLKLQRGRLGHTGAYYDLEGGGAPSGRRMRGAVMQAAAPEAMMADASANAVAKSADKELAPSQSAEPLTVRSDFSETAYFEPQLKVSGGRAAFHFKMPDQLTSWTLRGYALTKNAQRGQVATELVTQKELMVRVEMPRFFREKDEGEIKAMVHNETDTAFSGQVTLAIEEDGKPAAQRLGLKNLSGSFKVKAHQVTPVIFPLKVGTGTGNLKVRVIARAGTLTDAEERDLPLLPSRERLIQSQIVALDGNQTKVLKFPTFVGSGSKELENAYLQVDPQLAMVILNAIPYLVDYPYLCSEQLMNHYLPLAVLEEVFRKFPALRDAAKKVPARKTISPPWEQQDPRRLTALMETPWVNIAEGQKAKHLINVLDHEMVTSYKESALSKLKTYQNSDGGFPWFPGGRSDLYITLYLLGGFAEALRYNVEIPKDLAEKAFRYVVSEIDRQEKKVTPHYVAYRLYAAFVLTSYLDQFTAAKEFKKTAKMWVDFADEHSDAMTPFGKAYAAHIYWRLGENAKGDLYLERALTGSQEDPLIGVYWQPERLSWMWFNDSVEKHAFFLRTLIQYRPKDARIPGMVKWLLFNRKGNEWKSTKASAAAVYSLLDYMKAKGALTKKEVFQVNWEGTKQNITLQPTDLLTKPLRWAKEGAQFKKPESEAKVEKSGPGMAFASLTSIFQSDDLAEGSTENGVIGLKRKFLRRVREGKEFKLLPLKSGDTVSVGDEVEVQLEVDAKSQFEYLHLKAPRGAGFESEELLSGWQWDQLGRYEEPRDSLNNFFMSWVPHGTYTLRYRIRATTPGTYRFGSAVLQSMYAPEVAAHSSGFMMGVKP